MNPAARKKVGRKQIAAAEKILPGLSPSDKTNEKCYTIVLPEKYHKLLRGPVGAKKTRLWIGKMLVEEGLLPTNARATDPGSVPEHEIYRPINNVIEELQEENTQLKEEVEALRERLD